MFFSSPKKTAKKQAEKKAASDALSVSRDKVKTKLAELTDVSKQFESCVNDTIQTSTTVIKRLKKSHEQILSKTQAVLQKNVSH